jgi:hypothetical protein
MAVDKTWVVKKKINGTSGTFYCPTGFYADRILALLLLSLFYRNRLYVGSNLVGIRSHYIGLLFLIQAGLIQDKTARRLGLTSILAPSAGFVS